MGNCDSSVENRRKHFSKNSQLENAKYTSKSSFLLSHPDYFSLKLSENKNSQSNLKKYYSVEERNINNKNIYILPETIAKREDITKKYRITNQILGDGATSIVYLGENFVKEQFAIKRIPKDKIEVQKKIILKEAEISMFLNNKNIIKCYEIYEDMNFVSSVMELGETDLFELIVHSPLGFVPEEIAIDFLLQIFEVIDYLHSKVNIVHCDIKPENFVVKFDKRKDKKPTLKLIDFGNIRRKPMNNEKLFNFSGTKEYMAPETLENSGFNEKVDVWAAGVIMFNMLTGSDPFVGPNHTDEEYRDNIKFKEIKFEYIKNERLRELNKKLLNRYMVKRITAKEALIELKQIKKNSLLRDNINMIKNKDYDRNMNIVFNKVSYINMS